MAIRTRCLGERSAPPSWTGLIGPPGLAKGREESENYRVGAGASGDAAVHRVHTRGESVTVQLSMFESGVMDGVSQGVQTVLN